MSRLATRTIPHSIFRKPNAWLLAWLMAIMPMAVSSSNESAMGSGKPIDKFGEITVAQPKIWQYERVNTLLDGLLRDIEGISMADLTGLNPNTPNGVAVKFVQSILEIGMKYDRAAALTNGILQNNYQAMQGIATAQLQANSAYLTQLYAERQTATTQLVDAMQQNTALQAKLAAATPGTPDYSTLQAQQTAAAAEVTGLQNQLSTINAQITAASAPPAALSAPNVTGTSAGAAPETATVFSDFLSKLPPDLVKNLTNQLQSPTYPATKQMDNFITLLYERMAREISSLQGDLLRDPREQTYLVQFDVGLYPSRFAKNHVGRVEFTLDDCKDCKVYSLYPGQSSYNLVNYEGASKRRSFWGNFLTLIGLGISADYRRQQDTLHGDLTQSIYISGFQSQEATNSKDAPDNQPVPKKVEEKQGFGWYYGAAPFEQYVSPGIRSTFAIVVVPKFDEDGNPQNRDHSMKMTVIRDWVDRNDPYFRQRIYPWSDLWHTITAQRIDRAGRNAGFPESATVSVEYPDKPENSLNTVLIKERNRLHVVGLEYNTVDQNPPKPPSTDSVHAATPGSTTGTATAEGQGSASVTISGAGAATSTATGAAGSMASAAAPNPSTALSGGGGSTDLLTGCPKGTCAGVLITLDQPIDPNLVVTARGMPLRRVRDWRGRATSILPAAQSASDIPPGTPGGTGPQRSENAQSRSLLESDTLAPNTWYAVDSHKLLLNISADLAGDEGFPVIQIADPAKQALVIPYQLDQGYTEIIENGFHLVPRSADALWAYVDSHYRTQPSGQKNPAIKQELHPSGPYPFTTFLPLFTRKPPAESIYAYLGETGFQIIVGMLHDSLNSQTSQDSVKHSWLAARTQAILEDRDLDFAWSLSCTPQGPELICDVPQNEIAAAYNITRVQCGNDKLEANCPGIAQALQDSQYVTTLQLWVEQYDSSGGDNYFYSPVPASLGLYPIKDPEGFQPWHVSDVKQDKVTLKSCDLSEWLKSHHDLRVLGQDVSGKRASATIVPVEKPQNGEPRTCPFLYSLDLYTSVLTRPEVVLSFINPNTKRLENVKPIVLESALLRPFYGEATVTPHRATSVGASLSGQQPGIETWDIDIPMGRVDCHDKLDLPKSSGVKYGWLIGGEIKKPGDFAAECQGPSEHLSWMTASISREITFRLTLTKKELKDLPEEIHLLRDGVKVAWLPNLRKLTLPSRLKVMAISNSQFSLQGKNAGAIDFVSLQGPSGTLGPYHVGTGSDVALVSIPTAGGLSVKNPQMPTKPADGPVISDARLSGKTVTVTGNNFGTDQEKGKISVSGNVETKVVKWGNKIITFDVPASSMGAASVSVTVGGIPSNMAGIKGTTGSTAPDGPRINKVTADEKSVTVEGQSFGPYASKREVWIGSQALTVTAPSEKSIIASLPSGVISDRVAVKVNGVTSNSLGFAVASPAQEKGPLPGTYIVIPLVCLSACGTPQQELMPLEVMDQQGKPLTFAISENKPSSSRQDKVSDGQAKTKNTTKVGK